MVEDSTWPRFTLIGQSLGSIYLVLEAVKEFIPDLFVGEIIELIFIVFITFLTFCRYNGLRIHILPRSAFLSNSCWRIRALPNYK